MKIRTSAPHDRPDRHTRRSRRLRRRACAQRADRSAQLRHTASPATSFAPAASRSRAQRRSVAPDVNTSSTSTTRRPTTELASRTANASATFSLRERTRGSPWGRVACTRRRHPTAHGARSRAARFSASQAAWSKPRSWRRRACNGTGTSTARPQPTRNDARHASAAARTICRPAATLPSSLNRRTSAPPVPAYRHGATSCTRFCSSRWSRPQAAPAVRTGSPQRMQPNAGRQANWLRQGEHSSLAESPQLAHTGGNNKSTKPRQSSRTGRRRRRQSRGGFTP